MNWVRACAQEADTHDALRGSQCELTKCVSVPLGSHGGTDVQQICVLFCIRQRLQIQHVSSSATQRASRISWHSDFLFSRNDDGLHCFRVRQSCVGQGPTRAITRLLL